MRARLPPVLLLLGAYVLTNMHADPHEEKQKALLQRITGSVARLHEVLKEINTQIEVRRVQFPSIMYCSPLRSVCIMSLI